MPILRVLCYNGSLVTWTVVSLTTTKFQPLAFSTSGLALPYSANMLVLMTYYYCYWWGGTNNPRYCGHFWPIVQTPDDRWGWLWSNWWNMPSACPLHNVVNPSEDLVTCTGRGPRVAHEGTHLLRCADLNKFFYWWGGTESLGIYPSP
jgi:hypothetical protein